MKHIFFITGALTGLLYCSQLLAGSTGIGGAQPERAYLGIYSGHMSETKARLLGFDTPHGSYVSRIIPGSAAEAAGLQLFDYIFGVDEARVGLADDLTDLLSDYIPGDRATIHFVRSGRRRSVQVTLTGRNSWAESRGPAERAFLGITPNDEEREDEPGVRIDVIDPSTAATLGLRNGDLLLTINNFPMIDWSDITTLINSLRPGDPIEITFRRDQREQTVSGAIKSREAGRRESGEISVRKTEPAFLGIYSTNVSREKARQLGFDNAYGNYVTKALPGTGAADASVQPFDYIYGVDAYRTGERQNLSAILRKYSPGDEVELYLVRRSERMTLPVTLGRRSDVEPDRRRECEEPFFGVRQDHSYRPERGVGVSIVRNSTAEAMGLQQGDVITAINGHPIIDWQDVSTAINNMEVGESITVDYQREGSSRQGSRPIGSKCDSREREERYEYDDERYGRPRRPVDDIQVTLEDISGQDRRALEERSGLELAGDNALRIEGLRLTPDPDSGRFELEFNLPQSGQTLIRIYNESGRQLYNYDLGAFSGPFSDTVDLSQNGTGNYFLEVRQNGRSATRKIILSRR